MSGGAKRERELSAFAARLGVTFNDLELLDTALTHTSYAKEKGRSVSHNERLEFLGDAVLELSVSTYLFSNFPDMPEGVLTRTRASIVCSETLAKLANKSGFGKMLLLGHGEDQNGGRERVSILEDAFEAVIGAIYIDQGWEVARDYVWQQLRGEFAEVRHGGNDVRDYKSLLQELVQQKPAGQIAYELLSATGPDHAKTFRMAVIVDGKNSGIGTGHSKKEAEQNAAKIALAARQK